MSRALKWGCIAPITAVALLVLALFILDTFLPSAARRALPASASMVQEYYSDSWNGDFVRLLKARLPESDYPVFAKGVGLTQKFDSLAHADIKSVIEMGAGDSPSWWDPPSASSTTYFEHVRGDDYVKTLYYSHGTAYLFITSW